MIKKFFYLIFIFFFNFFSPANSEIIKEIIVEGNNRISAETIKIFSKVSLNDDINISEINNILKDIYSTSFFRDVNVVLNNNKLIITVTENPIIQNITFDGIKAQKILDAITSDLILKERSSYNEVYLINDKNKILNSLKDLGYYFADVNVLVNDVSENIISIEYKINLGSKAKIKKISFIGNKVFKDNKLKRIIISEEYKFWKIISGKKYLNKNVTSIDTRLLRNYYLNNGYYKVNISSTFAKLIDSESFELVFNIDAGKKYFFNNLTLNLPNNFEKENFKEIEKIFKELKNKQYSLYSIESILDKIDEITLYEQYKTIKATINEETVDDKINISFNINESQDFYVERINIYGNSITRENVIRNQFFLDEGDPYNEILKNKTINQLKSLNFFKNVDIDVLDGSELNTKILNIKVEEKPTGEISAGAGVGTNGNTIGFAVNENNYLGKGIGLNSNISISNDSIKGLFSLTNPNVLNSEKSITSTFEASELDKFSDYGYKTSRTGLSFSTNFEYLDDLKLGLGTSNYFQNIETDSTASEAQKKQKGNYFDSYLKLDFDYDKRNQKFQTSSGFRSYYSIDIPMLSKTYSLINSYNYQYFTELYPNNITSVSYYLSSVNSITGDNVKLSERLYMPSNKLRGFKYGAVGPKDGLDYIGGNFVTSFNLASTLPQIFENSQNTDFSVFFDMGNIWSVDYDSNIDDSNKLRSSLGVSLDWFTPIGPMNFSLSQPLSKASTDQTEAFRFNLGTTF